VNPNPPDFSQSRAYGLLESGSFLVKLGPFGGAILISTILKIVFLKIMFLKSLLFKIAQAFGKIG
jgi:hypothetical protein